MNFYLAPILFRSDRIVVEDYASGKESQLFKLVRMNKGKFWIFRVKFHMICKLKNKDNQEVAIAYKNHKLRIATYQAKDDDHEMIVSMSLANHYVLCCIPGIIWTIGGYMHYSNKDDLGTSYPSRS